MVVCCTLIEDVGYQLLTPSKSKATSLASLAGCWVVSQWDISGHSTHYVVFTVSPDPASREYSGNGEVSCV